MNFSLAPPLSRVALSRDSLNGTHDPSTQRSHLGLAGMSKSPLFGSSVMVTEPICTPSTGQPRCELTSSLGMGEAEVASGVGAGVVVATVGPAPDGSLSPNISAIPAKTRV